MAENNDITRKVAIVTGSSNGVGASVALLLARKGFNVTINCTRSVDDAKAMVEKCVAEGVDAFVSQGDISVNDDCVRIAEETFKRWGRIDALVNNAGMTTFKPQDNLAGLDESDWRKIMDVNVMGTYQMTRAAEKHLQASGDGAVVNVSSIAGLRGTGSSMPYAASKGAENTMTLSLARVLAPKIRVNAVCPGPIDTRWLRAGHGEDGYAALEKRWQTRCPLQRIAKPEEVADVIVFLIESAKMMTGETLTIDGGFTRL